MRITLSLDDELVRKLRKIAVEQETTLTGMVRGYLEEVVEDATSGRRRHERNALERSFERFRFKIGARISRADLYARS